VVNIKKLIFILLVSLLSVSLHAQLLHTKWKGAIKGDNPQNAVLKFGKDTLILYAATDGSVIETMTYSIKTNILTVRKISGQSDCDGSTTGKYLFTIKGGSLSLSLSSDACMDRSSALDKTAWMKKTN